VRKRPSDQQRPDHSARITLIERSGLLSYGLFRAHLVKGQSGALARVRETESGICLDMAATVIPKPRNSINAFAGNASVSVQVQSSLATTDNFDAR